MKPLLALLLALAVVSARATEYPEQGPDIYDPQADGSVLIAAALQRARTENKNVLLDFGANWCPWCHRLHHTLTSNPAVAARLSAGYILVMIDMNKRHGFARNAESDARYGHPTNFGLPVLVVLEPNGRLLTTKDSGELESGDHHDPAKVFAFLNQWMPVRP